MIAELKFVEFPDLPDAGVWDGTHAEGLFVYAFIGPEGSDASESFLFRVFTPVDLLSYFEVARSPTFGKGMLIVAERQVELVTEAIAALCLSISGESWAVISRKLALYGDWEFEDYIERKESGERGEVEVP